MTRIHRRGARPRVTCPEPLEPRTLLSIAPAVGEAPPVVAFHDPIAMPVQAGRIATADFNADGRLDVVASSAYSGDVNVLPGNGNGTFGAPRLLPVRAVTFAPVATGDVDGDGRKDVVVAVEPEERVYVFRGNGDGTFRPPQTYPVFDNFNALFILTVADVNRDGRDDIITGGHLSATAGLLLARADGTFHPVAPLPMGPWAVSAQVSDLDADGNPDLVVARANAEAVTVLWGAGDGTFGAPQTVGDPPLAGYPTVADFNSDGRLDLAAAGGVPAPLSVGLALNQGGRRFVASRITTPHPAGSATAANLVNDGKVDLMVAGSYESNQPTFMMQGNGDGTFTAGTVRPVVIQFGTLNLGPSGNFNGDGLTDFFGYREGNPTYMALAQPLVLTSPAPALSGRQVAAGTPLATFVDNHRPGSPASSYTASVNWGDGRTTGGAVVANADGTLTVTSGGGHTYPYNRSYNVTVTLTNAAGQSGVARGTAQVTDAPPPPTVTEFPAAAPSPQPNNWPDRIVRGPGQDLWFGLNPDPPSSVFNPRPSLIGRVNPAGQETYYALPGTGSGPRLLASDAEGDAWFDIPGGAPRLGQLTAAGAVTEYSLPAVPGALAAGADNTIWFAVAAATGGVDRIARVTQAGDVTLIPLTRTTGAVADMVLGPDGNFWLAQPSASKVSRVTPTGDLTEFALAPAPAASRDPVAIAAGPDGNLWFVERAGRAVGRITPAGAVTRFALPAGSGDPGDITPGPDGALWVVEPDADRVGRMTTDGSFSEYTLPTTTGAYPGRPGSGPYPFALTSGADGNVWFAEQAAKNVARVNLNEAIRLGAQPIQPRRDVAFDGEVARFTDPQAGRLPADYDAVIEWGDGATTPGTLIALPDGGGSAFSVRGSHTYTTEGTRVVRVTVTPFGDVGTSSATTVVLDDPLTVVETFDVIATEDFPTGEVPLMTFTDPDPDGNYGPFTATVDWGDGTDPVAGTVTRVGGGAAGSPALFEVGGPSHAFPREGTFTVRVRVADAGGATAEAQTTATVLGALTMVPMVMTTAPGAGYVVAADFTGDGRPDVLVSNNQALTPIRLMPGNGDGTLGAARDVTATPMATMRPVAADFDRDGKMDFATVLFAGPGETRRVALFRGLGDGTFAPPQTVPTSTSSALGVIAADLNRDGAPDLVTRGPTQSVVNLNRGDGTFSPAQFPSAPWDVADAALGDFDGDGDLDLAQSAARPELATQGPLAVFGNRGDGTFAAPTLHASPGGGLVAGDFDGDGRADLARAKPEENVLFVLPGRAGGGFETLLAQALVPGWPAGRPAPAVVRDALDVNRDGRLDLVGTSGAGRDTGIGVWLGHGDGTFAPPITFPPDFNFGDAVAEYAPADLNGDGRLDFVAAVVSHARVGVLINTPYTLTPAAGVAAHEGTDSEMVLGTLRHEDPPIGSAAGFTGTAQWGDGSSSPVRLVPNAAGGLDVVGSHVYAEVGRYRVDFVVVSPHGVRAAANTTATVANAPFAVDPLNASFVAGAPPVTTTVAIIRDANRFSLPSDFTARIDWGDGNVSPGFVRHTGGGQYNVYGTHAYATAGMRNVVVTVDDAGGGSGAATARVTVTAPANGGASVSGTVFHDADADGVREFGEQGVPVAIVYVDENNNGRRDREEQRAATTSPTGQYALADLPEGTWVIRHEPPPGYLQSSPPQGEGLVVTLARGQAVVGRDFGDTRPAAGIVRRAVFYNNSAFDGSDGGADVRDDNAIAPDKQALLPGQTATFANYTSYSRGINGLVVDLLGLPAATTPDASDFIFRVGTSGDPASWPVAPAPASVVLRRRAGAGGADRITLTWPDGAIRNTWLQVTVKAGTRTGLAAPDVFYVGNLVGDTPDANDATDRAASVGATDLARVVRGSSQFSMIDNAHDHNRDQRVDALDLRIVRSNQRRTLPLFTAPAAAPVEVAPQSPREARPRAQPVRRSVLLTP